jgi:hypothetical protein
LSRDIARARPALRIRPDAAAVLVDRSVPMSHSLREHVIGFDPASGLAVVRVPPVEVGRPTAWVPEAAWRPRYLLASDVSTSTFALRPVFVGSLAPVASPMWRDEIWVLPLQAELVPGSFVFIVDHGDRRAIVPAPVLLAEADRLLRPGVITAGYIGVAVQPLTPSLAKATGGASGVVVTWVDPMGPASGIVTAGDVLEAANDQPLATPLHWEARVARLTSGERVALRVRRSGKSADVTISAAALRAGPADPSLGLVLASRAGIGAVVTRVEPGSVSQRAGILAGDLITRVADVHAPTPAAVRRAFTAAPAGQPMLVALTRGGTHYVITLEK